MPYNGIVYLIYCASAKISKGISFHHNPKPQNQNKMVSYRKFLIQYIVFLFFIVGETGIALVLGVWLRYSGCDRVLALSGRPAVLAAPRALAPSLIAL